MSEAPKPSLLKKAKKATVSAVTAVGKKAGNLLSKAKSVFKGKKKAPEPTTSTYKP